MNEFSLLPDTFGAEQMAWLVDLIKIIKKLKGILDEQNKEILRLNEEHAYAIIRGKRFSNKSKACKAIVFSTINISPPPFDFQSPQDLAFVGELINVVENIQYLIYRKSKEIQRLTYGSMLSPGFEVAHDKAGEIDFDEGIYDFVLKLEKSLYKNVSGIDGFGDFDAVFERESEPRLFEDRHELLISILGEPWGGDKFNHCLSPRTGGLSRFQKKALNETKKVSTAKAQQSVKYLSNLNEEPSMDAKQKIPHKSREKQVVLGTLEKLISNPDRSNASKRIHASGKPVYTHDPAFPGLVVRVEADGTRTPGRFENRRFIPVGMDSVRPDQA